VLLTFDDGYKDNYDNMLPILKDYDARATIFVLSDRELTDNRWRSCSDLYTPLMDNRMLQECIESGHVEIGSHGKRHVNLTLLDDQVLHDEVHSSKYELESLLGTRINAFAYPGGACGMREKEAVRNAGYDYGVAVTTASIHGLSDKYAIRRRGIDQYTGSLKFRLKTSPNYFYYASLLGH
jgi:peptidoglycan/xylan/chitin deacetylase (PgdA/CDA1 family)